MGSRLHPFSSAFAGGSPGAGLLLLRATLGMTAIIRGVLYIGRDNLSIIGVLAITSGSSLFIGFLTPVVCVIAGLAASLLAILAFPPLNSPNPFEAALPTVLLVAMAAAIVFLGPGALSLDARLFGRREIIIPRSPRSQQKP